MAKPQKIVTPIGTAAWCAINPDKPDTKFEHQWYVDLIVPKKDAVAFVKEVKAYYEATTDEYGMAAGTNPIPIKPYIDADGNKTDCLLIKCKLAASGVKKDGTPWTNKPPVLFGADLNPFVPEGLIGKGSKMRVSLAMKGYSKPKTGIKFDIVSVQIIDAAYYGVQASADDFTAEEGTATTAAPVSSREHSSVPANETEEEGNFNF